MSATTPTNTATNQLVQNIADLKLQDTSVTVTKEESYDALAAIGLTDVSAKALICGMARLQSEWSIDDLVGLTRDLLMEYVSNENRTVLVLLFSTQCMTKLNISYSPLWMAIPAWQVESSIRLDQNYWSLAVAIQQVLPANVKLPTWLALEACCEPYPSIEQLLYSTDSNLGSAACPYWEFGGLQYLLVPTPNLHSFRYSNSQGKVINRALPTDQQFTWTCQKQHGMTETIEANSLNELGALLQSQIASEKISREAAVFSENSLFYQTNLVTKSLPKATIDLISALLMRIPNVCYARYNYTELKFDVLIKSDSRVDVRLRDDKCFTISIWEPELEPVN